MNTQEFIILFNLTQPDLGNYRDGNCMLFWSVLCLGGCVYVSAVANSLIEG